MVNFRPRPLYLRKESRCPLHWMQSGVRIFQREKNLWNPPVFEAQTQQSAVNALSAETLTVSLSESRDNCNSVRNNSQSCKNTADRYGRNLVSTIPTAEMKFHGFERRNMQRAVDSVSCVHMKADIWLQHECCTQN